MVLKRLFDIIYLRKISLIFFCVSTLVFSSCVTQKSAPLILKESLNSKYLNYSSTNLEFISIKTDSLEKLDSLVEVTKLKNYFVPAIILWAWNSTLNCKINDSYFTNIFTKALVEKAELYNLQQHLNSKRIEIEILEQPSQFIYSNQGSIFFGGFFYLYNYKNRIYTDNQKLKFIFRLIDDNRELKQELYQYQFQTTNSAVDVSSYAFLSQYMENLTRKYENVSAELIQKLIDGL